MKRSALDLTFLLLSACVLVAAIYYNALALRSAWNDFSEEESFNSYSYIGNDYPPSIIPLSKHKWNSVMFIEDSYHYSASPKDDPEWSSLFPKGGGVVRLGPKGRSFEISMYHQIRCLSLMQKAIYDEPAQEQDRTQVQNCFNHLRQMFLCASSVKLEAFKPDSVIGTDKVDGLDLEHKCRDWSLLHKIAEQNYDGWSQ